MNITPKDSRRISEGDFLFEFLWILNTNELVLFFLV